jgi:hypothetical protein
MDILETVDYLKKKLKNHYYLLELSYIDLKDKISEQERRSYPVPDSWPSQS